MMNALGRHKADGELVKLVATFMERQSLVRKPHYDALEAKYSS